MVQIGWGERRERLHPPREAQVADMVLGAVPLHISRYQSRFNFPNILVAFTVMHRLTLSPGSLGYLASLITAEEQLPAYPWSLHTTDQYVHGTKLEPSESGASTVIDAARRVL